MYLTIDFSLCEECPVFYGNPIFTNLLHIIGILYFAFRAAVISFLLLEYRHHLETEELEPLIIRNTIPLCMGQYERTFKSTR